MPAWRPARRPDHPAVGLDNDITDLEARHFRGRTSLYLGHNGPILKIDIERIGQLRGQVLRLNPQSSAFDLAKFDQLLHDITGHVDRYRKSDTDISLAVAATEDRGIDPHQLAAQVDQGTAGIAEIDRGIGLDKILIGLQPKSGAAERGNDTGGNGLAQAEWIADGDHEIADPITSRNAVGIAVQRIADHVTERVERGQAVDIFHQAGEKPSR